MYLVNRIDKGLSFTPTKTPNHLGIVVIIEDVRDQRLALVRSERAISQGIPRWNSVA